MPLALLRLPFSTPRRHVLGALGAQIVLSACGGGADALAAGAAPAAPAARMPDEADRHAATWMGYGATAQAWGTTGVYGASRAIARRDLMRIAVNLSRFEPVRMLVSPRDLAEAQGVLANARQEPAPMATAGRTLPPIEAGGPIELISQPVNDLWLRDTGPVFVKTAGGVAGVNFNFNGWGQEPTGAAQWRKDPEKAANGIVDQVVRDDQRVADFVLQRTATPRVGTWLVMEGGGIEVDGLGTALCTESCILNANRNPGRSRSEVEAELRRTLGITKVIWLAGVKAMEITDGHIDFYARFVGPARVVYAWDEDPDSPDYAVTQANLARLRQATDAQGRALKLYPLHAPDLERVERAVRARQGWGNAASTFNRDGFAAGYVGYYVANGCVLMPAFGDPQADAEARATLESLMPERTVMQIFTDGLANGGGTIHCATQQQIAG